MFQCKPQKLSGSWKMVSDKWFWRKKWAGTRGHVCGSEDTGMRKSQGHEQWGGGRVRETQHRHWFALKHDHVHEVKWIWDAVVPFIPKRCTSLIGNECEILGCQLWIHANEHIWECLCEPCTETRLPGVCGTPSCSRTSSSPSCSGVRGPLNCLVVILMPLWAACWRLAMRFLTILPFPWTTRLTMPWCRVAEGRWVTIVMVPGVCLLVIWAMAGCSILPIAVGSWRSYRCVLVSLGSGNSQLAEQGSNNWYHHQVSGVHVLHHVLLHVAVTWLEQALIDGTAFIPGLGLVKWSPIVLWVSIGSSSSVWKNLAIILNSHLALSTSKHPQTDGQAEVMNQQLETMLHTYMPADQKDWSQWLNVLQLAYNNTLHSSHKEAPAKLLLGFKLHSPLNLLHKSGLEFTDGLPELHQRLTELASHCKAVHNTLKHSLVLLQLRQTSA